jgi:hypothetical protein
MELKKRGENKMRTIANAPHTTENRTRSIPILVFLATEGGFMAFMVALNCYVQSCEDFSA